MIGRAYFMTIIVTVIGTSIGVVITSMLAYMLAQKKLPGRKILNFIVVFTMLFNGGLVPTYVMYVKTLHIKDTIWGLIFPGLLMSGFMVMLVRNYFENSIPEELYATVGLMSGISYWNDWQNGLYYLSNKSKNLYTIQNILNNINENVAYLASNAQAGVSLSDIPTTTVRMAIAVVGILPIIIVYPFFQKYFAKGLTMGAVKG